MPRVPKQMRLANFPALSPFLFKFGQSAKLDCYRLPTVMEQQE